MSKAFQNLAQKLTQLNEREGEKLPLAIHGGKKTPSGAKLALAWLRSSVAPLKEFAAKLGVGERQVYKWINEEAAIPKDRADEILWIAKTYAIPINQLRDETDLYLLAMKDPGNF